MTDQNSQFFAILTDIGKAKQANATALGTTWTFAQMAVGDANETNPIPNSSQTKLINERRRAPLNQVKVDPSNPSVIIAEQVIPESVGGWWVRELGLYDADGDMVAVANCAPTYKPLLAQGSGRTQVIRINLIVSNTANIELKIDPSVVLATREYVDLAVTEVMSRLDFKHSVLVATTANIVLSGIQTVDGVLLAADARVLVKDQAQAKDNGIYVVPAAGAWKRAQDADVSVEVTPGLFVTVEKGTANGDSVWQLVTDAPIVLGTTALTFEMVAGRTGVSAGSYTRVTVDKYGRVMGGVTHTTLGGYGITNAYTIEQTDAALLLKADKSQLGTAAALAATTSNTDSTLGRALRVGDFGWGASTAATAADANLIEASGIHSISSTTLNVPAGAGSGSMLFHMNYTANAGNRTATQEIVTRSNPARKFWRARVIDLWGPWIEPATSGANSNITALTGLTTRPSFGGYLAWDAGNFDPSTKINKDQSQAVGFFGGAKTAPYLLHADGTFVYLQVDRPKDTALLTVNGWSKNADNGEIVQRTEIAIGDATPSMTVPVTWPFQFPSKCFRAVVSFRTATGSPIGLIPGFYDLTTSGCTIKLEELNGAVQSGLVLMVEAVGY